MLDFPDHLSSSAPVHDADVDVCPLCRGVAELAFVASDRNREVTAQPFRYRRCLVCGAFSLVDVPLDLGQFYPSDYYGVRDVAELDERGWIETHKIARVRAHVPAGRLIEIGPGGGGFAHAARRAGYDVSVIEMDEAVSRNLREVVGLDTVTSCEPAVALSEQRTADVIAMWHVIEHLPNPWEVVAAASERLRPGGALVISAPNPESLQFRLLKARWAHLDAPRHVVLLPLSLLIARCAAVGLRLAEMTTTDPAGRHLNWMGWEYAARQRPGAGPAPPLLAKATLAFTLAMRPVEQTGLRGAAYTAVFVKD